MDHDIVDKIGAILVVANQERNTKRPTDSVLAVAVEYENDDGTIVGGRGGSPTIRLFFFAWLLPPPPNLFLFITF